jgi:hypothetical protein
VSYYFITKIKDIIMSIELKELNIIPSVHTVRDPSLALKRDIKEGLKSGILRIIGIIIFVAIISGPVVLIDNKYYHYFAAGIVIFGAFNILYIIKSMFVSAFKPNLRTPEEALRSYLYAIDNRLYERAYNMLTDQAKIAGDVPLPKEVKMEKSISRIVDLDTFTKYWDSTGLRISDINNTIHIHPEKCDEENTAIFSATIPVGTGSQDFYSKYVLVRRHELWFIAHGYLII